MNKEQALEYFLTKLASAVTEFKSHGEPIEWFFVRLQGPDREGKRLTSTFLLEKEMINALVS